MLERISKTSDLATVDTLYLAIQDVFRAFTVREEEQGPLAQSERAISLDFALDELTRRPRAPVRLRHKLYLRMLEQMARTRALSVPKFALLLRHKQAAVYRAAKPVADAMRHELSVLRRKIDEMDLPIEIVRKGRVIQARFDADRLRINVLEAQLLAKKGIAQFAIHDFAGAIDLARQAFAIDYDCGSATWLVSRVLQTAEDRLTLDVVMKTELALGRTMLRFSAAVQRLHRSEASQDSDLGKAQKIAMRMLDRLRRQWLAFGSWPFGTSPQDQAGYNYRKLLRELLEVVVDARRGISIQFDRFAQNSLVTEITDNLLAGRLMASHIRRRDEVIKDLILEIFSKLVMTDWLPCPAFSQPEFQEQVSRFLLARRIDWLKIFNRSSSGDALLRDDLHVINDDDDDGE